MTDLKRRGFMGVIGAALAAPVIFKKEAGAAVEPMGPTKEPPEKQASGDCEGGGRDLCQVAKVTDERRSTFDEAVWAHYNKPEAKAAMLEVLAKNRRRRLFDV